MEERQKYRLHVKFLLMTWFVIWVPIATCILLILKGLPSFTDNHMREFVIWVYSVTWVPALLAGTLVSVVVAKLIQRTPYFHKPYDFGRCFSLGAITGALAEALSTWVYRMVSHRPFSGFWIAGAMIAGCLVGAGVCSVVLWMESRPVKASR